MQTVPFAYVVLLAAFSLAVLVVARVFTRQTRAAAPADAGPRVSVETDTDRIARGDLDRKMEADSQRVGEIAHDLNDLLTAITGQTELLIASLDPASTTILDAYEIRRAALSAAQLTGALRTLSGSRANVATPPLAFEPPHTTGALEPRVDTGPLARVLVVEDEPGVRELIRVVLVKAGYDVVTVPGPRAALAALARQPAIDVLLCDVVMPEMDGYDLVAEARPLLPRVQVVFISAFAHDPKRHAPGDGFLEKPFTAQALTDIVKASLMGSER